MFIEAVILSLIVGLIRGGRLRNLRLLNKGSIYLLILGILIQYFISFMATMEDNESIAIILKYNNLIQILSYILIFIGIILNLRIKSIWTLLVGYGLNFMALASNGWAIPNLIEVPVEDVNFPLLGYTIEFFEPYPFPKILTLGDMVISFGIFALIQEIMTEGSYNKGYTF
ncbi:MAG: DUF5317 domain-containing protein [Tissierellia bacterium]|nr:DUF5317 domain-containing protein [Tissierellia bacterium]